jgi:MFS family permease
VAVAGAPSVERELGLSHKGYTVVVFAAPLVIAAALESAVAFASDALDRRRLVVAGQAVLAVALLSAALTTSAAALTLDLAVAGAASGVACGAAQALLVVSDPARADRIMVRWTLFASVGDVLAPMVTAAAIALGCSYRGAMAAVGAVVGLQCVVTALAGPRTLGSPPDATPVAPSLGAAARRALRTPRLWAWLFAASTCTLLDEIVVALAALRMREQGTAEAMATVAALAFAMGSVVGSALAERAIVRWGARGVLITSGILCAAALAAAVASHGVVESAAALFVVGVTCAPHHALALAEAYAILPASPGTVQALGQAFVVVDVGAPLALGAMADRWGPGNAIAVLVVQPVAILLCALCVRSAVESPDGGLSDER